MIRISAVTVAVVLALAGAGALRADLGKAKAELRLGRRARLALENAKVQFRAASEAYKAGDWEKTTAALGEVRESVELAYAALKQTGSTPRKSGDYKNLEIETRRLLKSLGDLLLNMSPDEREQMSPIATYVRQVHDEVLESIMDAGKGKKKR
jgi:hypothetical protein